jgi:hypothetical protein
MNPQRALVAVLVIFATSSILALQEEKKPEKPAPEKPAPEKPAPEKPAGKKGDRPIPRLAKDQLPPRTRVAPDSAKSQFSSVPVYVTVKETATTSNGKSFVPEVAVVGNYLAEYFRRAGHPVLEKPEGAHYRIEGDIATIFDKPLTLRGQTIAWKYAGDARITVTDRNGKLLDTIEIPDVPRINVKSEKSAIWDLRRFLAHELYRKLFYQSEVFANREIVALVNALATDPFESEVEVTADEVIQRLADKGLACVPYLLDGLSDSRGVLVESSYANVKKPDDLKIYHIADKGLEEIFQKISRLNIETPDHLRFYVMRGWENEWRRFCPAFRESPEEKRRKNFLHRKSQGVVEEKSPGVLSVPAGKPEGAAKPPKKGA